MSGVGWGGGSTRHLQGVGLRLQLTFPLLSSSSHETPPTPRFYKPYTKLRFLCLIRRAHARPGALWLALLLRHGEKIYFLSVSGPTVAFLTAAYRSGLHTAPELFGQVPFGRFPATASTASINTPRVSRASGECSIEERGVQIPGYARDKVGPVPWGGLVKVPGCAGQALLHPGLSPLPANLLSVSPEVPPGNYSAKGTFFQLTF